MFRVGTLGSGFRIKTRTAIAAANVVALLPLAPAGDGDAPLAVAVGKSSAFRPAITSPRLPKLPGAGAVAPSSSAAARIAWTPSSRATVKPKERWRSFHRRWILPCSTLARLPFPSPLKPLLPLPLLRMAMRRWKSPPQPLLSPPPPPPPREHVGTEESPTLTAIPWRPRPEPACPKLSVCT